MPSRNTLKQFEANTSYHCYNRGVEQRTIFLDEQDYGVFLNRLKQMLAEPDEIKDEFKKREQIKSFYDRIHLISYCLMPNHFHLLLHQNDSDAISEFMKTLGTSYTMYFNKRYQRVGHLFQGRYKARKIDTDGYNLHLSRYIHLNPVGSKFGYERYPYSSMQFLLEPEKCPSWLNVAEILTLHNNSVARYKKFVEDYVVAGKFDELDDIYSLD